MTVKVIQPEQVKKQPTFKKGELVISKSENANIYFVTGHGNKSHHFAGIRLSGTGDFAEYNESFLRDAVELFEGDLVIRND